MTGSLASVSPASSFSSDRSSLASQFYNTPPNPIAYPPTPPPESGDRDSFFPSVSSPRAIPQRHINHQLETPPLTPPDDLNGGRGSGGEVGHGVRTKRAKDALDFLLTIFPKDGLTALPFARSVAISAPNMGAAFDGVVLELPGKAKTLYVDGKSAESVSLRESIVALLDLADETLQCSALVIVLERSSAGLGDLLHSLMYVGGTVITKPPFQVGSAYILVGMEI